MYGSLFVPALPQVNHSETVQLTGLTDVVADLQVNVQRLPVMPSRLLVKAPEIIDKAEAAKRAGRADTVAVLAA